MTDTDHTLEDQLEPLAADLANALADAKKATQRADEIKKSCTTCGQIKPLSSFYRNKHRADGRDTSCSDCSRDRARAWRARHPDHYANYRESNREQARASDRAWRQRNADSQRERARAWREENPDYNREYYQTKPHVFWAARYRRRAKALGIEPSVEEFTKDDVIERYGDACFYCESGDFEHLDHATPITAGGAHSLANVRPSCASCNHSKHDLTAEEFVAAGKD